MSVGMQPMLPNAGSDWSRFTSARTGDTWKPSNRQMMEFSKETTIQDNTGAKTTLIGNKEKLAGYQALQARTSFYKGLAYGAATGAGAAGVFGGLAIVKIVAAGTLLAIGPIGWGALALFLVLTIVSGVALRQRHKELKAAQIETDTVKTVFKTIGMAIVGILLLPVINKLPNCEFSCSYQTKHKLTKDQLKQLSLAEIEQIQHLSPGAQIYVQGLRAKVAPLNKRDVREMEEEDLKKLDTKYFNHLGCDQVQHLTRDQLKELTKDQLKQLPVVAENLSTDQIEHLPPDSEKYVQRLRAQAKVEAVLDQAEATAKAVRDLDEEGVKKLKTNHFKYLNPDQVQHLTHDQLKELTKEQWKKLPVVIQNLSLDQIEQLPRDTKGYVQGLRAQAESFLDDEHEPLTDSLEEVDLD